MNTERYLEIHRRLIEKAHALAEIKSHDYSGEADALSNFKAYAMVGIEPATGVLTRIVDKLSRLANFILQRELKVKAESAEDTCIDGINYFILAYCEMLDSGIIDERTPADILREAREAVMDKKVQE